MKILIIYIVIIAIGVLAKLFVSDTVWEWFGVFDTSSAVALAVLAFYGYYEFIKNDHPIKIYFDLESKSIDTGLSILRKNFTRGELLGVLGMIQKDTKTRFEIESLKDISILKRLQEIQTSKEKEFHIVITQRELEQFNLR